MSPKVARATKRRNMNKLSLWKTIGLVGVFWAAAVIASPAQTFTTLLSFNGTDGANPWFGSLLQGLDGNFYGTTYYGGANDYGTVFKITPGGTLRALHCFEGYPTDGARPTGALVQATDGNFYGTTDNGGANCDSLSGCGTVFKITPGGALTTLHSFDFTDGVYPVAGLVQATDGNFYGTTVEGGAYYGRGTVFKIAPGGTLTTYSFDGTDGAFPYAGLVQATNGNLYGTTAGGGADDNYGTVFKITPDGTLTALRSFYGTYGANPFGGLVQATDGNFYGTTEVGGANWYGTVFKITPGGA
jgi:uncharacterized repeat protein (TIGR03803 family)